MAQAEKQLLIRLVARADGQPVIAGFGRTLNELATTEGKLQTKIRETNAEARRQSSAFGELTGSTLRWLGVIAGAAGVGSLAKQAFDYSQNIESTQIAIAGLLFANNKYTDSLGNVVDRSTAFQAANAESLLLLDELQRSSLKTAATVPQIADAFAVVYGALQQAGIRLQNSEIVQLTTRLTQTANAMKIPMEQIRQEINSLLTGQITEDSKLAKQIGLDNASVKRMQANGTLVGEVLLRTEGYALAAEAQANTFGGKLINTLEMVIATLSRALAPLREMGKGALDSIFGFFATHGDKMVTFVHRVVGAVDGVVTSIGKWISTHRDLAEEILSIGAIVATAIGAYSVLGAAIAALTSPITLTIAGIVAMALVWEKARKYSEIEVGGRPIAAYVRATMQIVATSWIGALTLQAGALKALWYLTKAVFGGLADLILSPIQFVVGQVNTILKSIPASVGALIPNFDLLKNTAGVIEERLGRAFEPVANAKKSFDAVLDTASLVSELALVGGEKAASAFATKNALGGAADLVKDVWNSAAEWLDGKLPELSTLGKKAAAALGITASPNGPNSGNPEDAAKANKAAEKLRREKDEYLKFIRDYREQANAAGDPLSQSLAKIRADRNEALSKLEAQKRQLKDAISADVFKADRDAINKVYDARAAEARRGSVEAIKNDILASLHLQKELTVGAQRETEDRRIALIQNSIQRELAERLAANRRWFEDESSKVNKSIENETERANQIAILAEERNRRDKRDNDDADRAMREQTFGYAVYWRKLSDSIAAQWRGISQIISDTILESRIQLAGAFNGFLDDLASGQGDLLKSLTGLSKGLTSLWTKALTEILFSGKNVAKQLQDLFKSIHVKKEDGSTDFLGTALQGASFGGAIGGLFQQPNNYAALGGSIGGALGAIIGTLAFEQTALGAVIGSAIGTAIGSLIQKGKDEIKVSIRDGVATVTEKGISAEARAQVQTQIQRKVKEETKLWQSLIDLFPQSVKDHLQSLFASKKLAKPTINLSGGVESADLTDEGALNALTDFLGNDLPKAALGAYTAALTIALGQLGVGKSRIGELFTYWGTLQGKELHEAVQRYVVVLLDAIDLRAKLSAPLEEKLKAASQLGGARPLQQLDEITAAIDAAVTRMEGLKDVEDIVAAQEEVNRLSRQYYELQLQHLARIQQIQQAITTSIGSQREQIQLAGKDDQGKVDFFFRRMLDLREQLGRSTDAEEIQRLTQQIQQYVSQSLGIAPDNPEMRDKLLAILTDIENVANAGLEKAKQEVANRDAKPASALERAAELLMKAAQDLSGATTPGTPTTKPGDGKDGGGGNPRDGGEHRIPRLPDITPDEVPVMVELIGRLDELAASRAAERGFMPAARVEDVVAAIRATQGEQPQRALTPEDFAKAMRDALRGMEFTAIDEIVVDNGDLGASVAAIVERRVIARIKDDPYSILPRAA